MQATADVTAPSPCSTCGAPGFRNVFAFGYCASHLSELYRSFSAEVWAMRGVGVQAGPRRPDRGPEYVELECVACGAGWVGALFERCGWCAQALERMQNWQAQLALTPPDVDPDDRSLAERMDAWAQRMATAVQAEIITEDQARAAWNREVRHVAA